MTSLQSSPLRCGKNGPAVTEQAGIHLDQLPSLLRCVSPRLCVVCGTNGLLALVCADGIACAGTSEQSTYFALTVDDFTPRVLAHGRGAAVAAGGAGAGGGGGGTAGAAAGGGAEGDFPPFSHASASDITAVDCTLQTGVCGVQRGSF